MAPEPSPAPPDAPEGKPWESVEAHYKDFKAKRGALLRAMGQVD